MEPLHERLNSVLCDEGTRSHTSQGQNMGVKHSAVDFVMKAPDHIPPEERTCVHKGSAVDFVMEA